MRLEDGSFAMFWLEVLPGGLTRYYDERSDRELRGLAGEAAALHLIRRIGNSDPVERDSLHRRCEFSGEFQLPLQVVSKIEVAIERRGQQEVGIPRRSREAISAAIRPHFMRQVAPYLTRYAFAEFENQL